MKVADLLVKCLENEGVKYVFGVPGEETEDLQFALAESEIEFIPCRHEQGAAFIANVWGRLTGEAGVCLSTLGPGATNLMTGVADANLDKAPVVAITGQGGIGRLHHESHQLIDTVQLFKPITKWSTSIRTPNVTAEIVRKAFKVAEYEKCGATHIELSEDIAHLEVDSSKKPLKVRTPRIPAPDAQAVKTATNILRSAARPLIIAGNGAIRNRASEELRSLVQAFGLPTVATFMGKGAVSDQMEQSLFAIGLGFKDYIMEAMEQADLVICIGYDIAEYDPKNWNPDGEKTIIHIDFSPAEVYEHYNPDVEVIADIAGTIKEMQQQLEAANAEFDRDWYAETRQRIQDDIASYDLKENEDFNVPGVINIVREILDDDGLLISDVGTHKMWIARNFKTYCPNGCIISNGMASMGISLPGGIAASLVAPNRQIVSLSGDGGFMMNCQELETAHRLGVGYTHIVCNDNNYGLITWKQERSEGKSAGTVLGNPDFKKFAESFGVKGYRPKTLAELKSTLEHTITSQELAVVEVPISTAVNGELIEQLEGYFS